jgi:hypothetical protein
MLEGGGFWMTALVVSMTVFVFDLTLLAINQQFFTSKVPEQATMDGDEHFGWAWCVSTGR